jgi:fructokinase
LSRLQRAEILVVGESLVDIIIDADGSTHTYAGGGAANTAVALLRLGRITELATSFANDSNGELIRQHLSRSGVHLANDPREGQQTSTAQATKRDGSATYTFDIA